MKMHGLDIVSFFPFDRCRCDKKREVFGVAPIPLKLFCAFSEESHSVNTIRKFFSS